MKKLYSRINSRVSRKYGKVHSASSGQRQLCDFFNTVMSIVSFSSRSVVDTLSNNQMLRKTLVYLGIFVKLEFL